MSNATGTVPTPGDATPDQPVCSSRPGIVERVRKQFVAVAALVTVVDRHSCATLTHMRGVPVVVIAAWLGHQDAGFTLRTYAHSTNSALADAAAVSNSITTPKPNPAASERPTAGSPGSPSQLLNPEWVALGHQDLLTEATRNEKNHLSPGGSHGGQGRDRTGDLPLFRRAG
jgi:hypothetical protein